MLSSVSDGKTVVACVLVRQYKHVLSQLFSGAQGILHV